MLPQMTARRWRRTLSGDQRNPSFSENFGLLPGWRMKGIKASRAPFVLLLSNDTRWWDPDFGRTLYEAIKGKEKAFSCASQNEKNGLNPVTDG
ncbi:MAG: hypothetical protein ACLR6B_16385 [Blautia sp.]